VSGQLSSGEALLTGFGAAATVADAVSACTVPRHPNEQRPVVAIVRRYVLSARVPLFPGSYINFVKPATYRAIASRRADTLLAVASLPPSPPSALIWIKGMKSGCLLRVSRREPKVRFPSSAPEAGCINERPEWGIGLNRSRGNWWQHVE